MRTLVLGTLMVASALQAAPPVLGTLQPGGVRQITQTLDVNIVFVGYEPGAGPRDINQAVFSALLPGSYRSINRYPNFYGIRQPTGLAFNFNYNISYASQVYEDALFGYLSSIAVAQPRTLYQNAYNSQAPKAQTVGQNHWINPVLVEKYLAATPPAGVDTRKYTVFFINWFGRADFKWHVYVKSNEPDPDTGYNFGAVRESRKMIAWGGTTVDDPQDGMGALGVRRVWFHDLSAGPEYWTGNFNIVSPDLDGDGVLDYRMPPVWEYGNAAPGLYRAFNNMSADLGRITRFVAVNLLFTTSPLYKPAISAPKLPSKIQLDINVYQGESGVDGKSFYDTGLIVSTLGRLQPWNAFSVQLSDAVFASKARDAYMGFATGKSVYGKRLSGIGFADLFLYHTDHLMQFLDGEPDYEVPVFDYSIPDALDTGGLLGFADDNWADGTQSFVFTFVSPIIRSLGYGSTTTTIHEVGHHLGMSHPHDGYDSELDGDYDSTGPFYYANSGDESSSMMSYIDLNWDFSQFDRDNMSRYMTSIYINEANAILAKIYASPRGEAANAKAASADVDATAALALYAGMEYEAAAKRAQSAYRKVLEGATLANVKVETQAWQADYKSKGKSPKFVDPLDAHRRAP